MYSGFLEYDTMAAVPQWARQLYLSTLPYKSKVPVKPGCLLA